LRELENAHRAITNEAPGRVLKNYIINPDSYKSSQKKHPGFLSPKLLVPVVGGVTLASVVAYLLLTSPDIGTENTSDVKQPQDTVPVVHAVDTTPTKPIESIIKDKPETVAVAITPPNPLDPNKKLKTTQNPDTKIKTQANTDPKIKQPLDTGLKPRDSVETATDQQSPLEKLASKYGSSDPVAIGKSALSARAFQDAIVAFENTPENHPDARMKTLLLLQAYVETGRTKDALFIANSETPTDAQYDFLCGKLYEKMGKTKQALDFYQSSLTKPSIIRNRNDIRNDALFSTAMLWSNQYLSNPSSDTRIQALNAWNIVKRTYSSNPEHERFKIANKELASIQ
jgi:hypothetical protein